MRSDNNLSFLWPTSTQRFLFVLQSGTTNSRPTIVATKSGNDAIPPFRSKPQNVNLMRLGLFLSDTRYPIPTRDKYCSCQISSLGFCHHDEDEIDEWRAQNVLRPYRPFNHADSNLLVVYLYEGLLWSLSKIQTTNLTTANLTCKGNVNANFRPQDWVKVL